MINGHRYVLVKNREQVSQFSFLTCYKEHTL